MRVGVGVGVGMCDFIFRMCNGLFDWSEEGQMKMMMMKMMMMKLMMMLLS